MRYGNTSFIFNPVRLSCAAADRSAGARATVDFLENAMSDGNAPLLIKRYASRRLYNTETSD